MPISPIDYIHPEDQAALDNLKAIPLFTPCMQAFMKIMPERLLRGLSLAQKVRLGPQQLPDIYQYLPPACEALGIEVPELYLEMNPSPNAYTFGDSQVFITVTSGLLEYLTEDEVRAVIGHECGHIACRHVLYHTMATLLAQAGASIFGPLAALSAPVQFALLYWARRSEFSADRAGAVVMREPKPVVQTMLRLAGGSKAITGGINLDLYIQQAREYEKLHESHWDQLLQGLQIIHLDHPLLADRTCKILDWCESEPFQRILTGVNSGATGTSCAHCGQPISPEWKFCKHCSAPNTSYKEIDHV